jgi:hypothetical protein
VTGAGGLSLTPAPTYNNNTNAGTATASYTYSGDANHTGSNDSKSFTIDKRDVTASISATDKPYDGTDAAAINNCSLEAQIANHGVVSPDAVGCSGSNGHFNNKNVGAGKQVTAGVALTGNQANYHLTSATALTTASIGQRNVTATITATNKVYDGTDAATINSCSLDAQSGDHGAVSGDGVGCSGSNGHFNNKNVATGKPVTGDVALTGTVAAVGNYHLTSPTAATTANITKAPLTVKAVDKSKLLGASDPALTYTITSGSLFGTDSFSGSLTRDPGETVGTYAIKQGTLTAGANYELTFVNGTLLIMYRWDGFLQPINDTAHQIGLDQSVFKAGSTVPAKLELKRADGTVVVAATAPVWLTPLKLNQMSLAVDETVYSDPPDSGSSYRLTGTQYIYNWSTKGLQAGYWYRIYAKFDDGQTYSVIIGLR